MGEATDHATPTEAVGRDGDVAAPGALGTLLELLASRPIALLLGAVAASIVGVVAMRAAQASSPATDETGEAPLDPAVAKAFGMTGDAVRDWTASRGRRAMIDQLIDMRRAAGLSLSELAGRMKVDPSVVHRMESLAGSTPKADLIAAYADACGYRTDYLFTPKPAGAAAADAEEPVTVMGDVRAIRVAKRVA